jgi:hypothetical protein
VTGAAPDSRARVQRLLRLPLLLVVAVCVLALGSWAVLAIRFSNLPGGDTVRIASAALFGAGFAAAFLLLSRRRRTLAVFLAAFAAVLVWWSLIPASHDRDWIPSVAVLPRAEIEGTRVKVHDVRNFEYRSVQDFDVRYDDRTYDLDALESVDFVKSHWDQLEDVAHTMLSFGFRGGERLAVSVETRLEKGEPQSAIRGLFKQYELIYVLADENDLIRLRTDFRGEDVYVYRTTSTPAEARLLFLDIIEKVNDIHRRPQFYDTFTGNCTTSLVPHVQKIRPPERRQPWWRLLLNGHTDRMAYEGGWIVRAGTFEETRALHHVNAYARDLSGEPYSRKIRPESVYGRRP